MTEEVKEQSQVETSTETESTLDDVYKQYNVEDTAKEFQARPEPQRPQQQQPQQNQAQPLAIPDPTLDPAGYRNWETQKHQDQVALRTSLQQVAGQLNNMQQAAVRQQEEADIRKAVDAINGQLGDSKLDPDVVEISLGAEARRDPRFLKLWEARHNNPKALQDGLKAFANKLGKKFSMRADPQLAENHRAFKEATSSTKATTAAEGSNTDKIGKLQGAEFQRALNQFRGTY
jgi:hypothetical protein